MTDQRVLVTGAAGRVGTLLRPRLHRPGRLLRLLDTAPQAEPSPGERVELVTASVTDLDALRAAVAGVDAVVHLGGISLEAAWRDILEVNVDGTRCVLQAAVEGGVDRVVLASSNHAGGFLRREDAGPGGLPATTPGRPDTYYGWSKAAIESLGSLHHSRHGVDVTCLRIGTCLERPTSARELATWLSPDDLARLLEACLSDHPPGWRVVWGISRNTRRWWSLEEGHRIGYHPVDDAEAFAAEIVAAEGEPDLRDIVHDTVGGPFCTVPLGVPQRA
jgi:NADP-dependent aldehyde dehydrogenase